MMKIVSLRDPHKARQCSVCLDDTKAAAELELQTGTAATMSVGYCRKHLFDIISFFNREHIPGFWDVQKTIEEIRSGGLKPEKVRANPDWLKWLADQRINFPIATSKERDEPETLFGLEIERDQRVTFYTVE